MFSKEQKVEIMALNYKAALKDLKQSYEAGYIRPIALNMAVTRLIQNSFNTVFSIGGREGVELFNEITKNKSKMNKVADNIRMKAQIAVLKEVMIDYQGKTIDNIIQQMEARVKELEKGGAQ